jgi:hypothetical protein
MEPYADDAMSTITESDEQKELRLLGQRLHRCHLDTSSFADEASPVAAARRREIQEWTRWFALNDFRDDWLATAIFLIDRAATRAVQQGHDSTSIFSSRNLWSAAVMLALKLSSATTELDCEVKDLLSPPAATAGRMTTSDRWEQVYAAERYLLRLLNFDVAMPTPLELVQSLCRTVLAGGQVTTAWTGAQKGYVFIARAPPKSQQMPRRSPLTRFEALATYLLELSLHLRPAEALSGEAGSSQVHILAVAIVSLALHSFGDEGVSEGPPQGCLDALASASSILLGEASARLPLALETLHGLWARTPPGSCVAEKWSERATALGGALPRHTAAAAIAVPISPAKGLEAKLLVSLTPRRRTQVRQAPVSATPPRRPSVGLRSMYGTPSHSQTQSPLAKTKDCSSFELVIAHVCLHRMPNDQKLWSGSKITLPNEKKLQLNDKPQLDACGRMLDNLLHSKMAHSTLQDLPSQSCLRTGPSPLKRSRTTPGPQQEVIHPMQSVQANDTTSRPPAAAEEQLEQSQQRDPESSPASQSSSSFDSTSCQVTEVLTRRLLKRRRADMLSSP